LGLAGCQGRDDARPVATAPAPSSARTAGGSAPADLSPAKAAHAGGIAWREAASDAQVDAAFAVAKAENKPVFVYWGAKWCPPCNQVQATLFNRQDFIARTRAFVPVYVDGDSPARPTRRGIRSCSRSA
jgi:thiol-disulfide isomerase/thioredoxin